MLFLGLVLCCQLNPLTQLNCTLVWSWCPLPLGNLEIQGGIYHLETGRVEFLGRSPKQSELLTSDLSLPPSLQVGPVVLNYIVITSKLCGMMNTILLYLFFNNSLKTTNQIEYRYDQRKFRSSNFRLYWKLPVGLAASMLDRRDVGQKRCCTAQTWDMRDFGG